MMFLSFFGFMFGFFYKVNFDSSLFFDDNYYYYGRNIVNIFKNNYNYHYLFYYTSN